jgi:putative endonuclease
MAYIVYAIKSISKNYIYVWLTDDIERRLYQHNTWRSKTTKPYAPFILIYTEDLATRPEARKREIYFKSWQWKEFLKAL